MGPQASLRRPPRRHLRSTAVVAVVGAVALATLAAGCASPRHTYVGSSRYNMVFRVPADWQSYSKRDLGSVLGTALDPSFAATYPFLAGFDAAPDPRIDDVVTPARLLDHPAVLSWIRKLSPDARDAMSLHSLRNAVYPVDRLATDGVGSLVDVSTFSLSGGYWGSRLKFIIRGDTPTTANRQLEFAQVAATDVKAQYEYVLIVSCSPDCFERNRSTINDILASWTLKG